MEKMQLGWEMTYLTRVELEACGFGFLGENVLVSDKAAIYEPEKIHLASDCRIDDFCIISGSVRIGSRVHVTPMCLIAGGVPGVELCDYVTLAYGVKIFSQSDDYSGNTMTNSLVPARFKDETYEKVVINRHSILGANSVVLPGCNVGEGVALGAGSVLTHEADEWTIYAGVPAKRIKPRSKRLLEFVKEFEAGRWSRSQ
jgi:acetyltransferase-like isoleucine patch superfamily enzyme